MQVIQIANMTILNDTYNSNPDSVIAALETLQALKNTGKKIAVLADMLELGPQSEKIHGQIGKTIAQNDIDVLLTFGTLSKSTYNEAAVKNKAHFENKAALSEYLVQTLGKGDAVLIKGSRGLKMEEVVAVLEDQFSQKAGT
jgi:UDP-N-acetylmuramoyl-tripeptide--D-alanyl-D-alanine ligase